MFYILYVMTIPKIPSPSQELQKNDQTIHEIYCSILDLELKKFMHYISIKDVWDNKQAIHVGDIEVNSLGKLTSNLASFCPNEETFDAFEEEMCRLLKDECDHELVSIISDGFIDLEEEKVR